MALCLFHTFIIASQENVSHMEDLKVGLVLSGGGAKGFAHVGVLKVLEEAGVRVDYIGGTSMGAIIGALYASGYSANELDSIVTSLNYSELMQDILPRKAKSLYQKENTEKYALTLRLKNGNIALPSAISKGQNVFNMLSRLTEHVHSIEDFSELPIPFFCVATNLENGAIEILEKGFLPLAVRASGSFPTLLDPVEIDGKLLTDGGVVNNFPVDIMRQKGVDLIIGVDVQDKLHERENLDSAPKIVMQIISFQMYNEVGTKRKETDLYLHPDISDYNVVSFEVAKEIIDKGESVAQKQLNQLKSIANKQVGIDISALDKGKHKKQEQFYLNKITIIGNKNYTKEYVLGKLKLIESSSTSYKKFNEGIDNLSATGNFKSIQYKFLKKEGGLELEFHLKEEEEYSYLQFGIHYDDLYKTGGLINYTTKHAIFKNDLLSADLILGDNIRYNIDYFIDNGFHWSYGIKTRYNKFDKSF
ncbi:MAG: patatin-like phospholipase family protein, partial [Flavobacteriaceae bacterium]|nr:patatin-like phospholipase family protein [Flavobacteriaceae bacterium]